MTTHKGDSKSLAGLVNLMKNFFDEITIGSSSGRGGSLETISE
jgi:hypothetical protein